MLEARQQEILSRLWLSSFRPIAEMKVTLQSKQACQRCCLVYVGGYRQQEILSRLWLSSAVEASLPALLSRLCWRLPATRNFVKTVAFIVSAHCRNESHFAVEASLPALLSRLCWRLPATRNFVKAVAFIGSRSKLASVVVSSMLETTRNFVKTVAFIVSAHAEMRVTLRSKQACQRCCLVYV